MRHYLLSILCLLLTVQIASAETKIDNKKPKSSTESLMGESFGKLPTFIKSDTLGLQSETRTFTYSGNVEVTQGDMVLTADKMEGHYDENNRIKDLIATGKVLISKGPGIKASGERAVYDAGNATVVLSENPELQQEGSVLSADRIRVFLNEDRSVAEGTVRVKLIQKDQENFSATKAIGGK